MLTEKEIVFLIDAIYRPGYRALVDAERALLQTKLRLLLRTARDKRDRKREPLEIRKLLVPQLLKLKARKR